MTTTTPRLTQPSPPLPPQRPDASLMCDPARLAFREIMNRHSQLAAEMEREMREANSFPPPPPPVPSNSPEDWTDATTKHNQGFSNCGAALRAAQST